MSTNQIILTFFKGKDDKVIARNQSGKICLLDINYCRESKIYINADEVWKCAIREERENCIIVQPITKDLTEQEREESVRSSAERLKKKYTKKG